MPSCRVLDGRGTTTTAPLQADARLAHLAAEARPAILNVPVPSPAAYALVAVVPNPLKASIALHVTGQAALTGATVRGGVVAQVRRATAAPVERPAGACVLPVGAKALGALPRLPARVGAEGVQPIRAGAGERARPVEPGVGVKLTAGQPAVARPAVASPSAYALVRTCQATRGSVRRPVGQVRAAVPILLTPAGGRLDATTPGKAVGPAPRLEEAAVAVHETKAVTVPSVVATTSRRSARPDELP